ncbi:uncharacterized protein LOC131683342 isoform X1 [Topomyia yanbarensis]|uniref:uncharacterized protein LOC131683342 isoform X1 n=1 Tax=Topomyia yanbarensis TaxID=2498891 RepID=UPI00273B35DD|nr:uncharacterized protein LOC131683342 isoform X1 [Topomyia yanbarensis]
MFFDSSSQSIAQSSYRYQTPPFMPATRCRSRVIPSPTTLSTTLCFPFSRSPGRTRATSPEKALSSPIRVEPFKPATSIRPGLVVELGRRVFRKPTPGKYEASVSSFLPQNSSISSLGQRRDKLLLYYQNVGCINSTVEEYRLAVSDNSFDIIVFVETWLNDDTLSSQVFGTGYEVFRCDRNLRNSRKSTGGGVLVAVHRSLKARVVEKTCWDCLEQVWSIIELGDRKLYLCALYVPPDRVRDIEYVDAHGSSVFTFLEDAKSVDEIIILGDFNLPSISWKSSRNGFLYSDSDHSVLHSGAARLLDSYSSATLLQINPIANENNCHLDLCFVSDQVFATSVVMAPSPLVKPVAHHPPLIAMIDRTLAHNYIVPPVLVSYDFHKADHHSIADLFSTLDWLNILDPEDVDTAVQTFSNVLDYVIDRHVPKKVHHQQTGPPWQTSTMRRLKSIKRAALRRFTKYRTISLRNYYVSLNHAYKRASQDCFYRYQQNIQRNLKSHPKRFWKYVNEQRKESGLPSSMTFNGRTATTPQDMRRLFSEKFANVFTDEALTVDQIELAVSQVPVESQTLSAIDVNETMITRACSRLKSSFNPGPDGFLQYF